MHERNQHLIARQILELDVASMARAPAVHETAARYLSARGMTEIEALFDRIAGPGRIIRLDRVEIDLGDLRGADWQDEFESRLVTRLARALEQAPHGPEPDARAAAADSAFERYLFFLRHGRLPWWGGAPAPDWPGELLRALEPRQWRALQLLLAGDTHAQHRLIHAADDTTLAMLLDRHDRLPETARVLELWRPVDLSEARRRRWRGQFWAAVLGEDAGETATERPRGVTVMRRLLELHNAYSGSVQQADRPGSAHTAPELPTPWRDWLAAARSDADPPSDAAHAARPAPRESANHLLATVSPAGSMPQEGEAIHLVGAGCVILHPFLEELFRSSDLLEGRAFRDETARARAVHLLGRLTFGDETTPEYDLLLPKLLCGMAWEEALAAVDLTDAERGACDQLLRAVLAHWHVLKSDSTDWLRGQFLLRTAKLERLDLGWRLTVERRAQDVLLDRLPWGLGVIGLPWMAGRIFVHWMK